MTYSSISVVDGKTVLSWLGQQAGGQVMAGSNYSAILARDAALTQVIGTAQGNDGKPSLVLGDLKPGTYYIRMQNAAGLRSETYRLELSGNWAQAEFDKASALQAIK